MNGVCFNMLDYGEVHVIGHTDVGAVVITLGVLYLIISLIILYIISYQRRQALQQEDEKALRGTIFPIFVYVLWANAAVNIYVGFVTIFFDLRTIGDSKVNNQLVAFSLMWGLQHVVTEGVAFMLMQKGVGWNAAKRSLRYSLLWGLATFVCYSIQYSGTNIRAQRFFGFLWNFCLLFFYAALWLTPQKRLYRRPAAILYAKFWFLFRCVALIAMMFFVIPQTTDIGECVTVFGTLFPFALFEPFVLYYTLLQDSLWWQGLDISQGRRKDSVEEIRSPLQGVDLAPASALSLAQQMDAIGRRGTLISAGTVRLLNFAYISLDRTRLLGSGSFSKVYAGRYRQRQCAIKLVFTLDLTQEIIQRIAAESQLLSAISHPNIVEIVGVAVLPPSVCILLELCHFGSLADIIHGTGALDLASSASFATDQFVATPTALSADSHAQQQQLSSDVEAGRTASRSSSKLELQQTLFLQDFLRGGPMIALACKRHLSLSWTDRLFLALGCARGLQALHAYSQNLVHRDVKSFNFLVDSQLNAKISDLELGTAEDLAARRQRTNTNTNNNNNNSNSTNNNNNNNTISSNNRTMSNTDVPPPPHTSSISSRPTSGAFLTPTRSGESQASSVSRFSLTASSATKHPRCASKEVSELGIGETPSSAPPEPMLGGAAAGALGGAVEGAKAVANQLLASVGVSSSATAAEQGGAQGGAHGERDLAADEFLANWAAPEVIRTAVHVQASDVYSLGLVLWELLAGRVPFAEHRRQDDIRYAVLSGQRPRLPQVFCDPMIAAPYLKHFTGFLGLMQACWAQDAAERPTMPQVVAQLEALYFSRGTDLVSETAALEPLLAPQTPQTPSKNPATRLVNYLTGTPQTPQPQPAAHSALASSPIALALATQTQQLQLSSSLPNTPLFSPQLQQQQSGRARVGSQSQSMGQSMGQSSYAYSGHPLQALTPGPASKHDLSLDTMLALHAALQAEHVLDRFALRNECWLLLLPPPGNQVLWATAEWQEQFNLPLRLILGKPFRHLSIFQPPVSLRPPPTNSGRFGADLQQQQPAWLTLPTSSHPDHHSAGGGATSRTSRFSLGGGGARTEQQRQLQQWQQSMARFVRRVRDFGDSNNNSNSSSSHSSANNNSNNTNNGSGIGINSSNTSSRHEMVELACTSSMLSPEVFLPQHQQHQHAADGSFASSSHPLGGGAGGANRPVSLSMHSVDGTSASDPSTTSRPALPAHTSSSVLSWLHGSQHHASSSHRHSSQSTRHGSASSNGPASAVPDTETQTYSVHMYIVYRAQNTQNTPVSGSNTQANSVSGSIPIVSLPGSGFAQEDGASASLSSSPIPVQMRRDPESESKHSSRRKSAPPPQQRIEEVREEVSQDDVDLDNLSDHDHDDDNDDVDDEMRDTNNNDDDDHDSDDHDHHDQEEKDEEQASAAHSLSASVGAMTPSAGSSSAAAGARRSRAPSMTLWTRPAPAAPQRQVAFLSLFFGPLRDPQTAVLKEQLAAAPPAAAPAGVLSPKSARSVSACSDHA